MPQKATLDVPNGKKRASSKELKTKKKTAKESNLIDRRTSISPGMAVETKKHASKENNKGLPHYNFKVADRCLELTMSEQQTVLGLVEIGKTELKQKQPSSPKKPLDNVNSVVRTRTTIF